MIVREMLPARRSSISFTIEFQGERYDVTTGFYKDGRLGEVFINRRRAGTSGNGAARLGEQLDAACRDAAIMISYALQYGATLADLKHSITRDDDSSPMSIVGAIVDSVELNSNKELPDDPTGSAVVRPRSPDGGSSGAEEAPPKAREEVFEGGG